MNVENILKPMRILLAVDGSEHSLAAVKLVQDMPLTVDSDVRVIAVLLPREAGLKTYAFRHFIEQSESMLKDKGVHISTDLLTGHPAPQIMQAANEGQVDLIVMGAKGLRATLGILLGGVAQDVVEQATCPVLVVRAPYTGIRNILSVTHEASQSFIATKYLAKFPFAREAEIELLHVIPPVPTTDMIIQSWAGSEPMLPTFSVPDLERDMEQALEEEAQQGEKFLKRAKAVLEAHGIVSAKTTLKRGDAATEIIEHIKTNAVDLVVASSRGLGSFDSWLLGSVSRKLVHYANCSVLIVKGKD